jgi:WW domain
VQEALARAATQLETGRTTHLRDSDAGTARLHNSQSLVPGYADDDEEDDNSSQASGRSAEGLVNGAGAGDRVLGSEDPLSGFLDELQSEGLLDEEAASALGEQLGSSTVADVTAAANVGNAPLQQARAAPAGEPSVAAATDGGAGSDDQTRLAQAAGDLGAGQRLLGWVSSGPWARVVDEASQQEYFWHSSTNEVAWRLPEHVQDIAPDERPISLASAEADPAAGQAAVQQSDNAADNQAIAEPTAASAHPAVEQPTPDTGQASQSSADADDLPVGWKAARDQETGETYYWHKQLGITQWERPVAAGQEQASAAAGQAIERSQEAASAAQCDAGAQPALRGHDAEEGQVDEVDATGALADEPAPSVPADVNRAAYVDNAHRNAPGEEPAPANEAGKEPTPASESDPQRVTQWKRLTDEESGDTYYWNVATGETSWELPPESAELGADDASPPKGAEQAATAATPPAEPAASAAEPDVPAQQSHAAGARPMQEHAQASAAVASALAAAAEGGALAALLPTCPRLLLLHAQLELRQRDLAALRIALRTPTAPRAQRTAAGMACQHIADEAAALAAELPVARTQADAVLAATQPEEGEVLEHPPLAKPPAPAPLSTTDATVTAAVDTAAQPEAIDDGAPPLPGSPASSSAPAPLPDEPHEASDALPSVSVAGDAPPPLPDDMPVALGASKAASIAAESTSSPDELQKGQNMALDSDNDGANHEASAQANGIATAGSASVKRKSRGGGASAPKRQRKEGGKAGAMVSKWQNVARTLDEEEVRFPAAFFKACTSTTRMQQLHISCSVWQVLQVLLSLEAAVPCRRQGSRAQIWRRASASRLQTLRIG